MGLFGNLFGSKKSSNNVGQSVLISGDYESKVYVYDGTPLKAVRKGETFYCTVSPKDITMTSKATGTSWSSKGSGDLPLLYNGRAIGFLREDGGPIRALQEAGYGVTVELKRTGTYMKGVPSLECRLPEDKAQEDWVSLFLLYPGRIKCSTKDTDITTYNDDGKTLGNTITSNPFTHAEVKLVLLEPVGRKKAHIGVQSNGTILFEIAATDCCYKALLEYLDHTGFVMITKLKNQFKKGSYYRITFVFNLA